MSSTHDVTFMFASVNGYQVLANRTPRSMPIWGPGDLLDELSSRWEYVDTPQVEVCTFICLSSEAFHHGGRKVEDSLCDFSEKFRALNKVKRISTWKMTFLPIS